MPPVITVALVVVHLSIAAVWLGSMVYSLFAVQPRTELAGYRRRLRRQATAMLGLVGAAFLLTLTVSVS